MFGQYPEGEQVEWAFFDLRTVLMTMPTNAKQPQMTRTNRWWIS